jgi:hypothetical protein
LDGERLKGSLYIPTQRIIPDRHVDKVQTHDAAPTPPATTFAVFVAFAVAVPVPGISADCMVRMGQNDLGWMMGHDWNTVKSVAIAERAAKSSSHRMRAFRDADPLSYNAARQVTARQQLRN